jgi:hypothetical protein
VPPAPLAAKLFHRAVRRLHDHLAQSGKLLVGDPSRHAAAVLVGLHRSALTLPPQYARNRRLPDPKESSEFGVRPSPAAVCVDQPATKVR